MINFPKATRPFLQLFFWLLLGGLLLGQNPLRLGAQALNQAVLVVREADGGVTTRCVAFPEEEITGYELLQRSGLEVVAEIQGAGALVCSIDGTGCPADDCLCQCQGGDSCQYWSYWRQSQEGWQYSQGGASMSRVANGTVEGWSWGPGGVTEALPPPEVSFADVCPAGSSSTAVLAPAAAAEADPSRQPPWATYAVLATIFLALGFLIFRAGTRTDRP